MTKKAGNIVGLQIFLYDVTYPKLLIDYYIIWENHSISLTVNSLIEDVTDNIEKQNNQSFID